MNAVAPDQAVLTVLVFSSLAAATAVLGVLPFYHRDRVPVNRIGLAYALASGLMLGAGYILMTEGLNRATMSTILGAWLGVGYTYWTHAYSGTKELSTDPRDNLDPGYSIKFILLNALHSASEGVAIGVAMVVSLRLGVFIAAALAVHNIAEAMVLTDILRSRNTKLVQAAGMCVITNVPQILLAIVAFAVTPAIPGFLSWALGFAAGAMVYLVITELLPSSYERTHRTAVAFLVSLAAGTVVLLKGFFG